MRRDEVFLVAGYQDLAQVSKLHPKSGGEL